MELGNVYFWLLETPPEMIPDKNKYTLSNKSVHKAKDANGS
jgi:hypothetical protein